ncbi:MAG TPA: hypothetical protein VK507_07840, partial [Iamia sp.]|nr:hypothetical protein [Iamia sp.]
MSRPLGQPADVRRLGVAYDESALDLGDASQELTSVDAAFASVAWEGQAQVAYQRRVARIGPELRRLQAAADTTSEILARHARELEQVLEDWDTTAARLADANHGQGLVGRLVHAAEGMVGRAEGALTSALGEVDRALAEASTAAAAGAPHPGTTPAQTAATAARRRVADAQRQLAQHHAELQAHQAEVARLEARLRQIEGEHRRLCARTAGLLLDIDLVTTGDEIRASLYDLLPWGGLHDEDRDALDPPDDPPHDPGAGEWASQRIISRGDDLLIEDKVRTAALLALAVIPHAARFMLHYLANS